MNCEHDNIIKGRHEQIRRTNFAERVGGRTRFEKKNAQASIAVVEELLNAKTSTGSRISHYDVEDIIVVIK